MKVDVEPLDRWGWECPECEDWNEEEEDPNYIDLVYCSGCDKSFEPNVTG